MIAMIANYLTIVGQPNPHHDLMCYALGGLDLNWNSFMLGITLRHVTLSFDDLYRYILTHERILDHQFGNSFMQTNVVKMNEMNLRSQGNNKNFLRTNNNNIGNSGTYSNWNL